MIDNLSKLLLCFFCTILFISCSKEDQDSEQKDFFYSITINGEEFHQFKENFPRGSTVANNDCEDHRGGLKWSFIGGPQSTEWELTTHITIYQFLEDFENSSSLNSAVIKREEAINEDCFSQFSFLAELKKHDRGDNQQFLTIDETKNNSSTITEVSLYEENGDNIIFSISGEFEIYYNLEDGSSVKTQGNYTVPVQVEK